MGRHVPKCPFCLLFGLLGADADVVALCVGEGGQGAALAGEGDPRGKSSDQVALLAVRDAVGLRECHDVVPFVMLCFVIIPMLDVWGRLWHK